MGAFAASGHGAAAAPFKIYDEISNKLLPPEESEMMLEALMSRDDHRFIRTYVEAKPMGEVQEYGNVLQVGLTFIPGADEPQVTCIELLGEHERDDEIRQGDNVICAGQYLIVAEMEQLSPYEQLVTNYLNIINVVEEGEYVVTRTRRGRNRRESNVGSARRLFFLNYSVLRTFLSFLELA